MKIKKWFAILLVAALFSCKKEPIQLPYKIHFTSPENTLSAIKTDPSGEIIAVGGDTWYRGICVESEKGNSQWQEDSIADKQLFGLGQLEDKLWTTGIDGYYFEKDEKADWRFYRLGRWDILRDLVPVHERKVIGVGGVALNQGVIYHIYLGNIREYIRLEHELRWIRQLSADHYIAGGYGLVISSSNGGYDWEDTGLKGDFFTDACFIDERTGYVIGYAGTVWKTKDGGENWEKKKGQNVFGPLPGMQAIEFVDEDTGFSAGENGRIFLTEDGGDSWRHVDNTPEGIDWHDITAGTGSVWLCGSRGHILELSIP